MIKQKPVEFELLGISTEQYAVFLEVYDSNLGIDSKPSVRFASDKAKRGVAVFSKVEHSQKGKLFMVLEVGSHFRFTEESWAALALPEGKIKLDKEFAAHLGFLALGTLRGILYEKTAGMPCGHLVIPLINLAAWLKEDVIL